MAFSRSRNNSLSSLVSRDARFDDLANWWRLFSSDDQAVILGYFGSAPHLLTSHENPSLIETLVSFWDPLFLRFVVGFVDLIPTLEEYACLLSLAESPNEVYRPPAHFNARRMLSEFLGIRRQALSVHTRSDQSHIPFDFFLSYFQPRTRSASYLADHTDSPSHYSICRIRAFAVAFAGIVLLPNRPGFIDRAVIPFVLAVTMGSSPVMTVLSETFRALSNCRGGMRHFRACAPLLELWFISHVMPLSIRHIPRWKVSDRILYLIRHWVAPPESWLLYLSSLTIDQWRWVARWGNDRWAGITHCEGHDCVPLIGLHGCITYYPGLAVRQFGGVQNIFDPDFAPELNFDYDGEVNSSMLLDRAMGLWASRSSLIDHDAPSVPGYSATLDFLHARYGVSSFPPSRHISHPVESSPFGGISEVGESSFVGGQSPPPRPSLSHLQGNMTNLHARVMAVEDFLRWNGAFQVATAQAIDGQTSRITLLEEHMERLSIPSSSEGNDADDND